MDVFFDNGILKNILKKSKFKVSENFKVNIFDKLVEITGQSRHEYISSPIMLLEYVGLKVPPISDRAQDVNKQIINFAKKKPFDANKFSEFIISVMKKEMENDKIFDYDFLKEKITQEEVFRDSYGIEIARSLFLSNLHNFSTRTRFLTEIILDDIQGLKFSEIFGEDWKANIDDLLGVFASALFSPDLNVPMVRILHHWYINVDVSKPASRIAGECKYDFDGNRQDRLDTQLVHFCCYGNKRDGKVHNVCGVTTETAHRIIKRCHAYLSFIAKLNSSALKSPHVKAPKPGIIVFADSKTGNLLNSVDLNELWNQAVDEVKKQSGY